MTKIKCPKCGSTSFDCYDSDFNMREGIHWDFCYCEDCDVQFTVKYVAVDIESEDVD